MFLQFIILRDISHNAFIQESWKQKILYYMNIY